MLAIFSCASAASGILGKNVWKSRYSCSACASEAVPPSAYQESPTASFARAIYSESGYVLISVCSVIRATSKRLRFMASMALSNSTLSGCTDATLLSGLIAFLFEQPTATASPSPTTAIKQIRRDIHTSIQIKLVWGRALWPVRRAQLGSVLADSARPHHPATPANPAGAPPGDPARVPGPTKNVPQQLNFLQRSFRRHLQQRLRILAWITIPEHGVARHQNFRAGPHHVGHRVEPHPAIHFNAVMEPTLPPNLR